MIYSFTRNAYEKESRTIRLKGRVVRESVTVRSEETGVEKRFEYDKAGTSEEYMVNECWDGEQDLAIFYNAETDTTLRVYETPYD
jgi:hypothetical protein